MNKTIQTIAIVAAVIILAVVVFSAGYMVARAGSFGFAGMMGNFGWNTTANPAYPAMMGGGVMMNGYWNNNSQSTPLTLDQAKTAAANYLSSLGNSDLKISEIMIFNNNAYVVISEQSTGVGAFELLVDPLSHVAYPEYGPNMMWNLKYGSLNHQNITGGWGSKVPGTGMMGGGAGGGMMGGYGTSGSSQSGLSANMPVSPQQAVKIAQSYLDANLKGASAATDPVQFYGYYTLDFSRNGKVVGMLSVNGYSGGIFLHTWHGTFIQEQDY